MSVRQKNNCQTCGGSYWVPDVRNYETVRWTGDFSLDGNDRWRWDGPQETVVLQRDKAIPCPDCNKLARAAYEDGKLAYLLAHRNDKPDEEEVRRRNIEKAKEKWDF